MASKGILVSDPSLKNMNPTRWLFEYYGIVSTREQALRTNVQLFKEMAIHFLGLDLVPPIEDPDGHLRPSPVDYVPLTAFMNPEFFQSTMKKRSRLEEQEKALGEHPSSETTMGYDEQLEKFDDLVPIFDEIFDKAEEKIYHQRLDAAFKAGVLSPAPSTPTPSSEPTDPPKKVKIEIE